MSRSLALCALFAAVSIAGVVAFVMSPEPEGTIAVDDAVPTRLDPRHIRNPDEPLDWVKQPPMIERTPPAEVEFASEQMNTTIRRWERAAGAMHDKDWFHQPWYLALQVS